MFNSIPDIRVIIGLVILLSKIYFIRTATKGRSVERQSTNARILRLEVRGELQSLGSIERNPAHPAGQWHPKLQAPDYMLYVSERSAGLIEPFFLFAG